MAGEHVIGLMVNGFERKFSRDGKRHTDYVELYNRSGMDETGVIRSSTWHRVEDLRPTEEYLSRDHLNEEHAMALVARWQDIEPKYQAWLNGQELPEDGIPLAAWPGLNKAQADGLQKAGYKTVEDVAAMPDQIVDRIPLPGVRELRHAARTYLENRPQADLAARVAELEAMLADRAQDSEPVPVLEDETEDEPAPVAGSPRRGRARRAEAA